MYVFVKVFQSSIESVESFCSHFRSRVGRSVEKRMHEERCHFGVFSRGTANQSSPKIVPSAEQPSDCSQQIKEPYFPSNLLAPPNKKPTLSILFFYASFCKKPILVFWRFATCKGEGLISHLENIIMNPLFLILFLMHNYLEIMFLKSCITTE